MSEISDLVRRVTQALNECPLRPQYRSEQQELQPDLADAIGKELPAQYHLITSTGGEDKKPYLNICGTSFWPDIEISESGKPLIAVEIKHIPQDKSASKRIAEAIGQALIYRVRYPYTIVFVLNRGKHTTEGAEQDDELRTFLHDCGIELILRNE
jgi:hypothetical protein